MKRVLSVVCVILLVFGVVGHAEAMALADLLGGGSITAADKLFTGWWLDSGTFDEDLLGSIQVYPIDDPTSPGLLFDTYELMTVIGPGDPADCEFAFAVASLEPSMEIAGYSLGIDGPVVGNDSSIHGDASLFELDGTIMAGAPDLHVLVDGFVVWDTYDSGLLSVPQANMIVDVSWQLIPGMSIVGMDAWNMRFTQAPAPVPEPATMLLLGVGLVGLAGFRRKFKK